MAETETSSFERGPSPPGGGVREFARETAEDARREGTRVLEVARERAEAAAKAQKDRVGDEISVFANALRAAAEQLSRDRPGVARYVERAAGEVESFSSSVRQQDIAQMVDAAERFARRQPALFLGGAVAAGFLVARFLKTSEEHQERAGPEPGNDGYYPDEGTR